MEMIREIEKDSVRMDHPPFRIGDQVKIHSKVVEGEKERIQIFEGVVTRRRQGGVGSTVTVRKVSYGVGVERIYPLHSPLSWDHKSDKADCAFRSSLPLKGQIPIPPTPSTGATGSPVSPKGASPRAASYLRSFIRAALPDNFRR